MLTFMHSEYQGPARRAVAVATYSVSNATANSWCPSRRAHCATVTATTDTSNRRRTSRKHIVRCAASLGPLRQSGNSARPMSGASHSAARPRDRDGRQNHLALFAPHRPRQRASPDKNSLPSSLLRWRQNSNSALRFFAASPCSSEGISADSADCIARTRISLGGPGEVRAVRRACCRSCAAS